MKKITLIAVLLSLALVACGEKKVEEVKEVATQAVEQVKDKATEAAAGTVDAAKEAVTEVVDAAKEAVAEETQVVNFKTADGETFSLNTKDLFETATLTSAAGETIKLTREVAADGIKLAGENTSIHFKNKEGILNIGEKEYKLNIVE